VAITIERSKAKRGISMTASLEFFSMLVSVAFVITIISPIVLITFLIRDWKRGEQW